MALYAADVYHEEDVHIVIKVGNFNPFVWKQIKEEFQKNKETGQSVKLHVL